MAASGSDAIQVAARYTNGLISTSKPNNAKEIFDIFDKAAIEEGKDPTILEKIAKPYLAMFYIIYNTCTTAGKGGYHILS